MRRRSGGVLTILALTLTVTSCNGTAQVTSDSGTTSLGGQTQGQRFKLEDLNLTAAVPVELGRPRPDDRTGDCPTTRQTFGTIPVGATDHDPRLFLGTTRNACPDQRSVNGSFPTWSRVGDPPPEREEVTAPAPVKAAYRFSLDYDQCTNECYSRTYDVVFVTLEGTDRTFWIQSTDVDTEVVDAILESVSVS